MFVLEFSKAHITDVIDGSSLSTSMGANLGHYRYFQESYPWKHSSHKQTLTISHSNTILSLFGSCLFDTYCKQHSSFCVSLRSGWGSGQGAYSPNNVITSVLVLSLFF